MNTQTTNSEKNRTGCLGMGLRLIGGVLVLLMLLAIGGAILEARAETTAAANFLAPGVLAEVNGRDMHIQCRGEGSPTIILDAGQGG